MFPHIISALRIAGVSLFFVFLGASLVSANTGPSSENAQLKKFYEYVFGVPNPTFTDEKIQFEILESGVDAAVRSENILDGSILTEDLADQSVTVGKLNIEGLCTGGTIPVFDATGIMTCVARTTIQNDLFIENENGLSGTGKTGDELKIDYNYVQPLLQTSCGTGELIKGFDEDGVIVCEENSGDNSSTNEIQDVILSGGLQKDGSNNFGLRDCNVNGQVLKSNGSGVWSCADDVDTDTQLTDADIGNFGYIKTYTETDPQIEALNLDKITVSADGKVGIGTTDPKVKLDVNGGIALSIKSVSADVSLTNDNYMTLCNANSGSITFTLPDATLSTGVEINIKKKDTTTNACRVVPIGSQLIDGQGEKSITVPYKSFSFISDGANWWIK